MKYQENQKILCRDCHKTITGEVCWRKFLENNQVLSEPICLKCFEYEEYIPNEKA